MMANYFICRLMANALASHFRIVRFSHIAFHPLCWILLHFQLWYFRICNTFSKDKLSLMMANYWIWWLRHIFQYFDFSNNWVFFQLGWGTKVYVQNWSEPSNNILLCFCLIRGSTLTSQDYSPSSVVCVPKLIRAIWRYLLSL